jgi:hypothetical protein
MKNKKLPIFKWLGDGFASDTKTFNIRVDRVNHNKYYTNITLLNMEKKYEIRYFEKLFFSLLLI